jgi:serine/threonine-protein kinase
MELINGPTLSEKVLDGPIPPHTVFRICSEVAAALAAAHAHGLVHRDIKPANVMVTPARAKVVDFGIAAAAGPGRPGAELLGTPAYLAPERLLSDTIEPASDVYALGVLLYRLLTNESPWSVDTTTQMLDAHIYIEPMPMPQLPDVPVEVTELVTACLRKEPRERPSAAEASTILADAADASVVQGLAAAVRGERPPTPAVVPAADVEDSPPPPKPGNRRKALAAGGAAVAVVAALLLWIFLPDDAPGGRDNQAAILPGASLRPPGGGVDAPEVDPVPGGGGEETTDNGSVLTPGAGGPLGSVPPGPATGVSAPGQATATAGPGTTGGVEPTTEPPATTDPPSSTRTLSSKGGDVVAECQSGRAELTSWAPAEDYKVTRVSAGPAQAPVIVFQQKAARVIMTVTCVGGVPTADVVSLKLSA